MKDIGIVLESSTNEIICEINFEKYGAHKKDINIGGYLSIKEGNHSRVLVLINSIKSIDKAIKSDKSSEPDYLDKNFNPVYIIETIPVGTYLEQENTEFREGAMNIPSPGQAVFIPDESVIKSIFIKSSKYNFKLGNLLNNRDIEYYIDGNKLFSQHLAIVGSTGSGKSCTVAKILQEVLNINNGINLNKDNLKNPHIIIFDLHSEYSSAFSLKNPEAFNLNILDVNTLNLPYWLMNAEELEYLFIESNEDNSHNQISQFKRAVIYSKEKHNKELEYITYDTPVFFDIKEVYNFIYNLNYEVRGQLEGEGNKPKLKDGTIINDYRKFLDKKLEFIDASTAKATKAKNGPFNGDFERFLTRLESKINDRRLNFIMDNKNINFNNILKSILGYEYKSNITILDLSGIPFEILSIIVSLISRLIFDFAFYNTKLMNYSEEENNIPYMLVCEEAHNYLPLDDRAQYRPAKKSIERIAKEGRKYGLNLMVVSQRPSEVSDTIFSQCNNFISLRLTNNKDQNYIKKLLPDNNKALVDPLPMLSAGEAFVTGNAVPISALVSFEKPLPEPRSESINVLDKWDLDWQDIDFENIINEWKK